MTVQCPVFQAALRVQQLFQYFIVYVDLQLEPGVLYTNKSALRFNQDLEADRQDAPFLLAGTSTDRMFLKENPLGCL